jgi:hypothetical protein
MCNDELPLSQVLDDSLEVEIITGVFSSQRFILGTS